MRKILPFPPFFSTDPGRKGETAREIGLLLLSSHSSGRDSVENVRFFPFSSSCVPGHVKLWKIFPQCVLPSPRSHHVQVPKAGRVSSNSVLHGKSGISHVKFQELIKNVNVMLLMR